MAKYKIAWMPGDGVGNDVMEAARIVLDRLKLDAEYVPCDIGWEFWCKEGNALPDRTVKALKETTCGLFGAITSKPQSEAKEELVPELKDKGLVYFSPIVGLRQMFNLHTNMRPCKSYPGNPLNFRGNKITNPSGEDVPIDQVVFRENTEGMYGGVEFFPLPEPVYTALCANPKMKKWKDKAGLENIALSTRIMSKQGCTNICKQAFEFAKKTGRKRVTLDRKTKRAARNRRLDDALLQRRREELSRHSRGRRQHRRHLHVDVQEPAGLFRARRGKHVRRHRERFVRRPGRRTRLRAERESRRQLRRLRTDARLGARNTPANTRSTRSRCC